MARASADDASARVIYKCGEWETNELMKKFEFALRNPYKVGTPVFALVVNADLQCWEYARIVKVHATDPRDPSIDNLTYEVNLEKQNTPIFCNHEQVAPMRVRMTASEYSTMMDMDTEETFCIKKMNAQEVKTAKDSWWIGVVPLYWHEHSKHLTVMRVTDAGRYRHPFLTVAYNPVDKDRTYRVHVASQSLEEFCREQGQLQLRDHHTFGIGLEYYFHTDHDKHLWQEGKILSFSPFFRRYVVMIDGSKFLFDHCLDQIAYAQYDDPDKSSTSASGEKVLVNWINKEKQTAEIVLYNFADNESQLPVKTLVTKASNVKFFKWAAGIIKNQEEQRLSQGACTIA